MDYKEKILAEYRKRHKGAVLSWLFENFINSLPSEKEITKRLWEEFLKTYPISPKIADLDMAYKGWLKER